MALPQISDIGRIIKDPSILKGTFRKPKPDVVYDIDKGVARLPTKEDFSKTITQRDIERRVPSPDISGLKVSLPEIEQPKYTYDPRSEMYTSVSPTGGKGTVYSRPPTIEEQRIIQTAQEKGSAEYILGEAERRVVTPVLELKPVKTVTTAIREYPFSGFALDVEREITGREPQTFGERIVEGKEVVERATDISRAGWLDISGEFFKKAKETKTKVGRNIFETFGAVSGGIAEGVKLAPSVVQYTLLTPAGGAAVDILAVEEKKAKPEKYVKEALDAQYSEYKKEYAKAETELEEGYELEPQLSKEEFEKEYGGEIKGAVESSIRREAVIPFTILATAGAFKLGKGLYKLGKPTIIESSIKGGEVKSLKFTEQQIPIMTEKGIKTYAKFKLMGIRTPVTAYKQSPIGKLLGLEPKLTILQRGQTYVTQPVANILGRPVEVGKQYLARFGRVGKGGDIVNAKFISVGGKEVQIPKESLFTLPKTEQYLFKSLIEKTKTGIPVSYERLSKYIPEEELLSMGISRQAKIFELGTGRATSIFRTGSITRPIKEFPSGAGTFSATTGFKDITFPFYRAAGKIPTRSGIIIRYPPISTEVGTGVDVFMGGGKKSSEQFLRQLYQLDKPVPIPKPVIRIPTPTKPVVTTVVKDVTATPLMVGGTGLKTIPFEGTGTYEVTESFGVGRGITGFNIVETLPSVTENVFVDIAQKPVTETRQDIGQQLKIFQQTKAVEKISPFEVSKVEQIPSEKVATKQLTRMAQKQAQKLMQKQVPKQIQRQIQKQKLKPPKTPSTKIPFIKKGLFGKEEKKKGLFPEDLFEVFVKKRGEDIKIGEFPTLPEARTKLFKELKQTLRASGFVERAGEKVKVDDWVGREFRKGKREPLRIVQKRERRLGTMPEVEEIQFFRKTKQRGGFL